MSGRMSCQVKDQISAGASFTKISQTVLLLWLQSMTPADRWHQMTRKKKHSLAHNLWSANHFVERVMKKGKRFLGRAVTFWRCTAVRTSRVWLVSWQRYCRSCHIKKTQCLSSAEGLHRTETYTSESFWVVTPFAELFQPGLLLAIEFFLKAKNFLLEWTELSGLLQFLGQPCFSFFKKILFT